MASQSGKKERSAYDASLKLKFMEIEQLPENSNVRDWRRMQVVLKDIDKTNF